jgi:ATP-binding cassette subfamily B (MDR/TAP) protein 1
MLSHIHHPLLLNRWPALTPSIRLLSSLVPRHHFFVLVLPAILSSLASGGITHFMTIVVGQTFDAFAHFPTSSPVTAEEKQTLLRQVGLSCLKLIALAVGSIALSSLTSCLWIWVGEMNAMSVRKAVYRSVITKEMFWFDLHLGAGEQQAIADNANDPLGAGGVMAKFARSVLHSYFSFTVLFSFNSNTANVRMASSLASSSGMLLQYLTTCIACLILAFIRSWSLTLVILSAVPILMFVQALSQSLAAPLLLAEREQTGISATIIDRAISAISTVKDIPYETTRAIKSFNNLKSAAKKLNLVWGFTSGLAQFRVLMMDMFVQGFWYGAKLVRENKIGPGDVMAVFWACLIAASNLQMCIPQLIILAKGKSAIAALLGVVDSNPSPPSSVSSPNFPRKILPLLKIVPSKCSAELALNNALFAYPSRPTVTVLKDVSLFLPANKMMFIVGPFWFWQIHHRKVVSHLTGIMVTGNTATRTSPCLAYNIQVSSS